MLEGVDMTRKGTSLSKRSVLRLMFRHSGKQRTRPSLQNPT
jgi:hypothetical protein